MQAMAQQLSHDDNVPALVTIGEYTVYPLERCSEDEFAELFCKMSERGNPVLHGRPKDDLKLLGKAMYRKSNILRLGNIAFHKGTPVAIGCNWDVADGGVWEGSGLEMPTSMAAHAAIGKGALDSLGKRNKKIWYCGFYGVVAGHSAALFSYLGTAGAMMANALGFEEVFLYSLLSSLQNREGLYSRRSDANEKHWMVRFADIDTSPAVSADLKALDGIVQLGLIDMGFSLQDDYMGSAAKMVKIKSVDELRLYSQEMSDKQLAWIKQSPSACGIPSKL